MGLYRDFKNDLSNLVVAMAFATLVLSLIGLIGSFIPLFGNYWFTLFDIIISYLITDMILSLYIIFGGVLRLPVGGKEKRGYAYLAYAMGIVFATIVSSLITLTLVSYGKTVLGWGFTVIASSIVIVLSIFLAFRARFFVEES